MMTINQLCCAGAMLAFVLVCLLIVIWCLCIVAGPDRRIGGNGPTS